MTTALFSFVALAWVTWLFSGVFAGKQRVWLFILAILMVLTSSYALYSKLGANKEIQSLVTLHESLVDNDLRQLLDKTAEKEISIEELFSELRLRNLEENSVQGWMTFGRLLLESGQLDLAEQAFNRAATMGTREQQNKTKLEVAQNYIEKQEFSKALSKIELVLLTNPKHEGALLMKGLAAVRDNKHQIAIDAWSYLLSLRDANSDSATLIKQQIQRAQEQLKQLQNNYVEIQIDNFSNLPLHSFTKAFALVRPSTGGAPIAVKAIDVHKLTPSIKITPADLMLADADLWQPIDLYIEIRLSKTGFAKPEVGDLIGKTDVIQGLKPTQKFTLSINESVK